MKMNYYVKEMADKSAVLMSEDGFELASYPSVKIAIAAYCEQCLVAPQHIESHYSYLAGSRCDFEDSFLADDLGSLIDQVCH